MAVNLKQSVLKNLDPFLPLLFKVQFKNSTLKVSEMEFTIIALSPFQARSVNYSFLSFRERAKRNKSKG